MKLKVSTHPPLLRWCLAMLFLGFLGLSTAYSQANDLCSGAISIGCGDTETGSTVGATADATLGTCGTDLTAGPGVWYEFVGNDMEVTVTTCNPGTDYDTKLGVFSGSCAGLTCVGGNDDTVGAPAACDLNGLNRFSTVVFNAAAGTTYYIYVTGFLQAEGNYELSVACEDIGVLPCTTAEVISCGDTVTGNTANDGETEPNIGTCGTSLNSAPGVWYAIQGNGGDITVSTCNPGTDYDTKLGVFEGTCENLVCVGGNDDTAGAPPECDFNGLNRFSTVTFASVPGITYFIYVTGFLANAGPFELSVECEFAFDEDVCQGALPIGCDETISGTTNGFSSDPTVGFCGTSLTTAPGVWFEFQGTGDQIIASTCNQADYDTKIGIFSGSCDALVCVAGNDDGPGCAGFTSEVGFTSVVGTTYYIYVTGFGGANGDFDLTLTCIPPAPGDACTTALPIDCDQTVSGNTSNFTADGSLPFCGTTLTSAPGIWYELMGDGSFVTATTCSAITDYDTKLGVFTGSCDALTCVTGNDDDFTCIFSGFQSTVTFLTTPGETYYIYVTGFGSSTGNYELSLDCCDAPQAICQDLDFVLNNTNPIVITPADVDDGSTADCGLASLELDANTFDCFDTGANPITLTITDINGNSSSAVCNVNIVSSFEATEVGCLGDLNITLDEDCSRRITPLMVATGENIACASNIVVTVDGTDSDVITGCGDHIYMVEVFEADQIVNGIVAANWGSTEDTGNGGCPAEFATVSFTAASVDLSIRYGAEVTASYTAPFDGTVSFNYSFNGADPTFDFFILDVNGVEIVNETLATAGAVVESMTAGQTIVARITDDDFCGIPAGASEASIFDFTLVSDARSLVNSCWGTIHAEDKTAPEVVCPDDTDEVTVQVTAYPISGTLSVTDPTLNLNNYSCFSDLFQPLDGDHNYDVIEFKVNATDIYTFDVDSDFADAALAIYQGSFDPANPCQNIIGQNQDAFGLQGNIFDPRLRFSLPLIAGESYYLFVTNWNPADFGNYTVEIFADNNGSVQGIAPVVSDQVFDLLCDDVDYIRFSSPQYYVVNADGSLDFNETRDVYFGGSTSALNDFLEKLDRAGRPDVSDNCGQVLVCVIDGQVDEAGDCGLITLERVFTITDRYNACLDSFGPANSVTCPQTITFRRPTIGDIEFPPFAVTVECDENFPTDGALGGPDDNVAAALAGFPFIRSAAGFQDLDQSYCNIGASYSDEPRIVVCDGTYKYRREWNIIDWCDLGASGTLDQLIKVTDVTGPKFNNAPDRMNVSTSPFGCVANVAIPVLGISDGNGCSSVSLTTYTVLANGTDYFTSGDAGDGDIVQLPIGDHVLVLCAEDDCGNETCIEIDIIVRDLIAPTAACNDELNVSIGGGDVANGIEGIARIFATDVNEGSNDNCGDVTLRVRRNFWFNETCHPSAARWSPWGDFVDFYCCDIGNEITIELEVTDEEDNKTICWLVVTPEDKLVPWCYAPDPVTLTCVELPLTFPGDIEAAYDDDFEGTSAMMSALFGNATGTDNCAVDLIVERTPSINVNDCGWGTITRRFEAWQIRPEGDANGNGIIEINEVFRSTNSCSQLITITEVHDFVIDFPEDADADCGDPDVPTIITETDGCDVLSINIGDPVRFNATGDECYKMSITYDVINWCLWDGEYTGYVIARMTEDDGEDLAVDRAVEGNERPVVRYDDDNGLCIDRRHNDRDGDSSLTNCESPDLPNYGRYVYTQFIKVYDTTVPVVTVGDFGGPTDLCPDLEPGQFGDGLGTCEADVSIPFSVSDECELFDGEGVLVVSIVSADVDEFAVDANGDGIIKSNEFVSDGSVLGDITDNGDGTFVFTGSYPIITSAMGPNVVHAIRVLFEDGCGNQTSQYIEFDVVDCKGPAPICINGLTVTLMPQGDGTCAMAIWASDFEGSPIYDCTGQGPETHPVTGHPRVIKYAIYRASTVEAAGESFVPSPTQTGIVLTDQDDETTVVYIYAFDEEGNYDFCETYVLVQLHNTCIDLGNGSISGVIATEDGENIEGAEVNLSGSDVITLTTNGDGSFSFENLVTEGDFSVTPYLNTGFLNGVSTFDLVLMSKHILGTQPLDSPYKRIAADINMSTTITTLDMIKLRRVILNIDTDFGANTSWRFVAASHNFIDPSNPWATAFPEVENFNNLIGAAIADFVGVKIGDVNGSAQANAQSGDDRTLNGQFNLDVENVSLKAGNTYTVAFTAAQVDGFQGTLALNGAELVDIEYGVATAENFGLRYAAEGMITTSWNDKSSNEGVMFSLVIRATQDAELSNVISVSSRYTVAEAYDGDNIMDLGISFSNGEVVAAGFELYQNTPNPFQAETLIGFNLPADAEVTVTINDASGRVLTVLRTDAAAGYNTINVSKNMIQDATGVLTYTVTAGEFTATKTMIAIK